ncbi:antibiotic biosynthesis monooxygenase [Chloroflexi bacterium TSY]|nr:antibiotic biosynthesis monooxygenase [Chloroflexi bacterium TSY]
MVTITPENNLFTVLVHYRTEADEQQALIDLLIPTVDVFARQPGFVSLTMHRSEDSEEVLVYLQWRSRADSEACMNSPDVFQAGQEVMGFIQSGRATMDVRPVDLILQRTAGEGNQQ